MKPEELRELRKQAGITQEQLAGLLGRDRMTISRWESGKVPIDFAKELAIRAVFAGLKKRLTPP